MGLNRSSLKDNINVYSFSLAFITLAWISGIVLASFLPPIPTLLFPALLTTTALLLIFFWGKQKSRLLFILGVCLLCGAWRFASTQPDHDPQAIAHYISHAKVQLQGVVTAEPSLTNRTRLLTIEVSAISPADITRWSPVHGAIEVQTLGTMQEDYYGANYGDAITLSGVLLPPSSQSLHGVQAVMAFPRVTVNQNVGNPVLVALYHIRILCANSIAQSLPQPLAALLTAILLGLRTPDLAPLTHAFNVTGTAHLIVPSGFKVTIVAGFVIAGTRWLYIGPLARRLPGARYGVGRIISTLIVVLCIAIYTILSGAGPAAIRAGIMGSLFVIAPRIGRTYNIYTALAFTALIMSLQDPSVLWDTGFLLSFLGTLGIVLLTPYFQWLLRPLLWLPCGHIASEMIAVTLAAQVATLPIFAIAFQQVSLIAPLANILTVPLLGILIICGMLICGIGFLSLSLAIVCGWVTEPVLWYTSHCILWCASLPGAYFSIQHLSVITSWLYYALLLPIVFFLLHKRPHRSLKPASSHTTHKPQSKHIRNLLLLSSASAIIVITGIATLRPSASGTLSVTFLTIGPQNQAEQSSAIFIRTADGKTLLVDGGSDPVSLIQQLDELLPSWQRSLDMVILTVPLTDHLTGLQGVVEHYQIKQILDAGMLHPSTTYTHWRRTISEHNLHYTQVMQRQTIPLGSDTRIEVLWPGAQLHKGSNEIRDNGLIVRLVTPGLRMLLLSTAVQSPYALTGLLDNTSTDILQAEIVQIAGENTKTPISSLVAVLQKAHPSLLIVTPSPYRIRRSASSAMPAQPEQEAISIPGMQVQYSNQVHDLTITAAKANWHIGSS